MAVGIVNDPPNRTTIENPKKDYWGFKPLCQYHSAIFGPYELFLVDFAVNTQRPQDQTSPAIE